MFRVLLSLMMFLPIGAFAAQQGDKFTSCGPGYILTSHKSIDGIPAYECQKLWCRDLETGKPMGSGDKPNTGYIVTKNPVELCDATGTCIECFGDRSWCKKPGGKSGGEWNPEYGAYTRGGDTTMYVSYLSKGCWMWQLGKPDCPNGETAVQRNGEWLCVTSISVDGGAAKGSHSSSIRRTGTLKRL